jgi:hypothetical protein
MSPTASSVTGDPGSGVKVGVGMGTFVFVGNDNGELVWMILVGVAVDTCGVLVGELFIALAHELKARASGSIQPNNNLHFIVFSAVLAAFSK